jgi:hypothetical protein
VHMLSSLMRSSWRLMQPYDRANIVHWCRCMLVLTKRMPSRFLCCTLQVRSHFRPEFVNRIDEFIVFQVI